MSPDEVKTLRVSDNAAGGFIAPPEFAAEIVKNIVQFSPIRQYARVQTISAPEVRIPTRTGAMTAAWVGEVANRSGTEPAYGQIPITPHEVACYVDVSNALLEDAQVDMANELAIDGAEEFGRIEGEAFVKGDGTGKPKGILVDTTVTGLASGTAATLGTAPENTLVAMFYKLPAFYRANAAWGMNSNTMQAIRLLKDSTGRFLWQEGLAAGQPGTLLGRPVIELPDMDDVGANKFPIVFGDMGQAYRIIDRVNLSVLRDPYTRATNGITRFHMRRRVGGGVVKGEAIVRLKCATAL
jgi:HK97 family phage major capsid protein